MAGESINRRLNIYINDREVTNSLAGVEREMRKVQSQIKNLNKGAEDYENQLNGLSEEYNRLSGMQRRFVNEINDVREATAEAGLTAEEAQGAFSRILSGISSGNLKDVQEGLVGLQSGLWGAVKAGAAFVATPFGFLLTLAAGLVVGTKALFDYNAELTVMNKKLTSLGVAKPDLSAVRSEIMATAKTFDKEFDEIAEKANSLSKAYGISMTDANDIIARGLANGGAQNSEYLDSLGEYDEFFSRAGYSAQNLVDIINTGYENGTYADKLPDALKEANLALEEQTKTTRDALVNAFGASFSDEILNKVATGELTTKQALEQISIKSKEAQLNQQQYAQLTADVFKGAGEDAGGAAVIFDLLSQSSNRAMSTAAKSMDDLRLANERLAKSNADAFEIGGFEDAWIAIKIVAIDALASTIEAFSEFKTSIQPIIDLVGVLLVNAWISLKTVVGIVWEVIKAVFAQLANTVKTSVAVFTKLLKGDFSGALKSLQDGFVNFGYIVANVFIGVKNTIIESLIAIVDHAGPILKTLGVDINKVKKSLEGWKSQKFELRGTVKADAPRTPTNGDAPEREKNKGTKQETEEDKKAKIKAAEDYKKLMEQRAKEQAELAKQLLQTERAAQDAQLALMKDGFEKERDLINTDYSRKIQDLQNQLIKESELKELQKGIANATSSGNNSEVQRLQSILDTKLQINKNYNDAITALESTKSLKIAQLQEKYLEIELKKQVDAHKRQVNDLQIQQNFELQAITSFQQAKALLAQKLSPDELKHVRSLEQAKKLIKEQQLKEQYDLEKLYLEKTAAQLQEILNNNGGLGFDFFSDEERDKVLDNLEQVSLKLSSLTNPKSEEQESNAFDTSRLTGVDILGFDAGKWEVLFEGLDTFAEKLDAVKMVSYGLQNAFGQYFAFMEAGENRTLAAFQKSVDRKKSEQSKLLERGYIDQEVYNARVARLEEDLNRKKAELEYKQAKRKKAMSIVDTIVNTATAIMQAYAQLGPIGGTIAAALVGTMGALQIATIAKQPLPDRGYKVGGYTGKGNSSDVDGLVHKNEYVVPTDVLYDSDPRTPAVMEYLENKRTGKSTAGFMNETPENINTTSLSNVSNSELLEYVVKVVQNNTSVLEQILAGNIEAYLELDVKTAKKIRDKIKQLETIENNRVK